MHTRLLLCPRNFDAQNILLGKWPASTTFILCSDPSQQPRYFLDKHRNQKYQFLLQLIFFKIPKLHRTFT